MYVLNCIDRMLFACMLSYDGKLIIWTTLEISAPRCALMCYPSSNITYYIACLLCIGVILLNKFNQSIISRHSNNVAPMWIFTS